MSGNVERFEKAMSQGHNAAWDQMWDRAAQFYRQALEEIPDDPKALTNLALALYENQQYEEALAYYQQVARLMPEDPVPTEKVADLFEKMGKLTQAIDAFMKSAELYLKTREVNKGVEIWLHVIQLRPDHLMARSRLALVYERLGRKAEAVSEYLAVASLLQNSGEVQKAIQAASRALKVNPSSAEVGQALSMIKAGKMLPKPGKPRIGVLAQPASKPTTGDLAAGAEGKLPDPISEATQKALAALAALMFEQDEQDTSSSSRRGMADILRGAFEAASGQIDQTRVLLHLSQVIDFQTKKLYEQAAEELEKVIDIGLQHPAAMFDLGFLQTELGNYKEAVILLSRVTGNPDYALAARLLGGKAYLQLRDYPKSAVDCLEALRLADMEAVPAEQAHALGQLYDPLIEAQTQSKEGEPPIQMCESILEMLIRDNWRAYITEARKQIPEQDPSFPSPLAEMLSSAGSNEIVESLGKIQRLARKGKTYAAMEEAFFTLRSAAFYLPLHVQIGDILLQQGQFNAALDKFNTVARSYEIRGEVNRAIGMYRRISDLSPINTQSRSRLIGLMINNGQNEGAIEEYLQLSEMYYNLADLDNVRRTINEALLLAQHSNASRELKMKVLSRLADIEMQSLNWRQALLTYEQMRTLQPQDEKTRASLIDLYLRLGQAKKAGTEIGEYINFLLRSKQNEQAAAFLEKLQEQYGEQGVVVRQQAEYLRQTGQKEEAIQKLDTAGELYLQEGDRAAAMECVMMILSLNPPNAAQYQQLLAQIRSG
jgi:tetratricopeptide (TPR) repeat protein